MFRVTLRCSTIKGSARFSYDLRQPRNRAEANNQALLQAREAGIVRPEVVSIQEQ